MRIVVAVSILFAAAAGPADRMGHSADRLATPVAAAGAGPVAVQPPAVPVMVDTPTVKALTGLTVQEFEAEMQLMTQALGLSCGSCHARGNFASDANPRKLAARRMIEMTKALNHQYFPDYKPLEDESRLGRVTCFTCHQGDSRPKTQQ
jgi:photosynthetic reaction center cytochrome c subunit